MSPNFHHQVSRKEFLKMGGMTAIAYSLQTIFFQEHIYGMIENRDEGDKSLDEKMKTHVAMARAITNDPYKKYPQVFKNDGDKELRLAAAAAALGSKAYLASDVAFPIDITSGSNFSDLLLNIDPDPLYRAATVGVPSVDFAKSFDKLDKDMTSLTGIAISGVASLGAPFIPELAGTLAVMGAVGNAISGMSSFIDDKSSKQIIGDNALLIVQTLWNDPAAKYVMTKQVKNTLREVCGIDFDASIEENKKYLPASIQNYVDIYLQSKGLTTEELKQKEDETVKAITTGVNGSLQKAVTTAIEAVKQQQNDQLKKQIEDAYTEGEIKGAIYIATFLSDHFISPKAGKIVAAIASSALKIASMIGAGAALGPVGLAAGCVMVALDLCGAFGKSGPSADELIMEAIGKVQDSINALHKDMIELFKDVFDNQAKMMERIDAQFEFMKTQQVQALNELNMIQQKIEFEFDIQKQHNRDEDRQNIESKVTSLNTIINEKIYGKKKKEDVLDQAIIKQTIETCHTFGMNTTRYGDFTGLPHPEEAELYWDAQKMLHIFETSNLIDYSVGYIPLIISRFAPTQSDKIGNINNPKGLGYAAMTMATAYAVFPDVAKKYEIGRYAFLGDLGKAITNTKISLLASVSLETIKEFKTSYLEIVEKLVDQSLSNGEKAALRNNSFQENENSKLIISGPCMEISSKEISNVHTNLFDEAPENSILENGDLINIPINRTNNTAVPIPVIGNFKVITWEGVNYKDPAGKNDIQQLFQAMEDYNIINVIRGSEQVEDLSKEDDDYMGRWHLTGNEKMYASQIIIKHADGRTDTLGDSIKSGWIEGKLSKQQAVLDPVPDSMEMSKFERSIQYISTDLLNDPNVGGSSFVFLDKLKENANVFYKLRKDTIENTQKAIIDPNNLLSFELEASAKCLKFLGGLNTYVRTGNINLGTAVFKDLVPGINPKQNSSGNEANTDINILVSTRYDVANLVNKVASKEYLYDQNHILSQDDNKMKLTEYIKLEIKQIAAKSFNSYINAYFSKNQDVFNLPELTISQTMLTAANKIVHKSSH